MDNHIVNKPTLKEFNYLRGIGIFLVVLGHSFPFIDEINIPIYKYIHSLIYSFHMPLFIMISGFFAYKILDINSFKEYKEFVLSKFKKLMIPYFTISFITIPIKLILNSFSERKIVYQEILTDIFLYPWNNPIIFFWFIYVLFLIFVFSPLVVKINKYIVLTLFFILSLLKIDNIAFMGISTIFNYSIYFFIGLYFREFYIKRRESILNFKFNPINSIFLILIPTIIFILNINFNFQNIFSNLLYILKSFLGIYLSIILCILIYQFKNINIISSFLNILGKYSFDIYLLSWFPQIFVRIVFSQILNLNYNFVVLVSLILGFTPIIFSKYFLRRFGITKRLILGIS